ncbi:hypothetical protein FALBO_7393 [Fusarium albosuccineum]|uniref:Uncharacterized protein n=1 Tax=Fusarium albosuccineum TaxID=1237068 RepID=A0A8H4LDY6_9HYPO|nr:hypothetical protein FALBO_7393 [Fusarium albosuccineum]
MNSVNSLSPSPSAATRGTDDAASKDLPSKLLAISQRQPSALPNLLPAAYATVSAQDFADKGWHGELGDARCLPAARFTDGDLHTFHDAFALWVCHGLALDRTGHSLYFELALREDTALDGNR